jgi:hypothetical protein
MITKKCLNCKAEKSNTDFNKCKNTIDKLQSWCKSCKNEYRRNRRRLNIGCNADEYKNNREKHLLTCKRRNARYRQVVIEHYSPKLCCVKCGFDDIRALSIDHKNSDGASHRKELNGKNFYKWLIENQFPSNFQVLCMNCQFIKRHEENEYRTHDKEKISPYTKTNHLGQKQIFFK